MARLLHMFAMGFACMWAVLVRPVCVWPLQQGVLLQPCARPPALFVAHQLAPASPHKPGSLQVVSDPNGAFTRFLGMEQGTPDAAGARSLRYAAVVDDGVLLKVVRTCRGRGNGLFVVLCCCGMRVGSEWSCWEAVLLPSMAGRHGK